MTGFVLILLAGLLVVFAWGVAFTMHRLRSPRRRTYASAIAQGMPGDPSELSTPLSFKSWTLEHTPSNNAMLRCPVWEITGARNDGPVVILAPGWGDSRIGALARLEAIAPVASRIIAIDTPGLGEADGLCGLGVTEPAILRSLIERAIPEQIERVILMGWSLGGGAVIQAASELSDDDRIAGVIAESPSRLTITPARNVMRAARLPYRLNLPLAYALLGLRLGIGYRWRGFDRAERAAQVTAPLLILHGEADEVCPIADGRDIADAAPSGHLETIPTASHNDLWTDPRHRARSIQIVRDFIATGSGGSTTDTPVASGEAAHH